MPAPFLPAALGLYAAAVIYTFYDNCIVGYSYWTRTDMHSIPSPRHHKNIRLDARNYIGFGWYFLTLCTFRREPYFRSDPIARWILHVLHQESARHALLHRAYCVMPDHLHLLLHGTAPNADLLQFVKTFKHKTSFRFRVHFGKSLWQTSFYDHILRDEETPADVAWYIWLNPVRAGLAKKPPDYPYSGPFSLNWPSSGPPTIPWSPPAIDNRISPSLTRA